MRFRRPRITFNSRVVTAVVFAGAGLLALVIPSGADVSADSPSVGAVRLESPATLEARGAAVTASVTVVCTPGAQAFLNVSLTERVGGDLASGFGNGEIPTCTGGAQTVIVNITAESAPFRRGTAFGTANLFITASPGNIVDQREIEIVRP